MTHLGTAASGSGLTDVNASALGGLGRSNFWQLGGNNLSPGQFLGSANNQPLELWANGQRALRLEPDLAGGSPNVIGGSLSNAVSVGVTGATIAGGGATNYFGSLVPNSVNASYGAIGGGFDNHVKPGADRSVVAGGYANNVAGVAAAILGGAVNYASADFRDR